MGRPIRDNIKRKVVALVALMALLAGTVNANASPVINHSGGSASSSVILNLEPYEGGGSGGRRFSVTVPIACPIWVTSDNTVITASNAQIVNNSSEAVKVVGVKIQPTGSFKLVRFDSNFTALDNNSYKFGMVINNDEFNPNTKALEMTNKSWNYIEKDASLPIIYTARFAPITKQIKDFDMAEIVFTVCFVN